MSLYEPKVPQTLKRIVLLGYSRDGAPKDLCDTIAQRLTESQAMWVYVFSCSTAKAWPEAVTKVKEFDVAAIGGCEIAGVLLQRFLSNSSFPGSLIINISSTHPPHSYMANWDVLSIYGSEEALSMACRWTNTIGSRHRLEIVTGANSSFAGHFTKVADIITSYTGAQSSHRFWELTQIVDRKPRTKQIEGVDLVRDAGFPPLKPGILFRGTNLIGITPKGEFKLRNELGVQLVVDLRPPAIRQGLLANIEGIKLEAESDISRAVPLVLQAVRAGVKCLVFSADSGDTAKVLAQVLREIGVEERIVELDFITHR